ncbi:MAG: hypothetical protein QMD46_02990 [Methanomicrobiales archaeon]|nr:hypothetical protein [Methanomicrobiales archaeon]MDI6875400.1 hypothetical protein [Methanomicrobiales archaeon]
MAYNAFESDTQRYVSLIIRILNDVDDDLQHLKDLMSGGGRIPQFVLFDATKILEKSFYNCQVVGETLRQGYSKRYLTRQQVDSLNRQLQDAVRKMAEYTDAVALFQRVCCAPASQNRYDTGISS